MNVWVLCLATIFIALYVDAGSHLNQKARTRRAEPRSPRKSAIHNKRSYHKNRSHDPNNNSTDIQEKIKMVRLLVYDSKFMAMSTHSIEFPDYIDANLQITADGGCGIPYTYMSKNDLTAIDLLQNNKTSILFSQATVDNSCDDYPLQAKDPKCGRALLIGEWFKVEPGTQNYKFGKESLFKKVPGFADLDEDEYDVGKLSIRHVLVRGDDGKEQELPLDEYMNYPPLIEE
uniref:Putative cellular repressor of transcription n=1 Tax=Xenopsylla cheopis TaxID=163159 RepID=A0A6M2DVM9_XENCH